MDQLVRSKKGPWDAIEPEAVARMRLQNRFKTGLEIARYTADIMRREHAEEYRLLTSIDITGQYIDNDRNVHLQASRPLFRQNRAGELVQVSYNNYDRAPFYLPAEQTAALYRALKVFASHVNDPAMQYRRRLAPGRPAGASRYAPMS